MSDIRAEIQRARELLDAQTYQPNPYDRLMTEALNSAEETGRRKATEAVQSVLNEWADKIKTNEAAQLWAAVRLAIPLGPL